MKKTIKKNKADLKVITRNFLKIAILVVLFCIFLISLTSYNEFDPSPFSVGEDDVTNILGKTGAYLSAILFFLYGQSVWLLPLSILFLIRLIIVLNLNTSYLILRFIIICISVFMISLSFELFNISNGILGKALIIKANKYVLSSKESLKTYAILFNFIIFTIIYCIAISRSIKSYFKYNFTLILSFLKLLRCSLRLLNFFKLTS